MGTLHLETDERLVIYREHEIRFSHIACLVPQVDLICVNPVEKVYFVLPIGEPLSEYFCNRQ